MSEIKIPKNTTAGFYTPEMIEKHGSDISGKSGEIFDINAEAFFQQVYIKSGFNPRQSVFGSDEEDIQLIEAAKSGACFPPIEITKGEAGKYSIVSGHRRYQAIEKAIQQGAPIQKISVRVLPAKNPRTGLKYTEADLLALTIGQNRGKALTHSEMSDTVIRLKKFGWKNKDIATALSLSENQVHQYSVLSQGTEELKKAVDAGTGNRKEGISLSRAVKTVKEYTNEPELMDLAVEEAETERKEKIKKPKTKIKKDSSGIKIKDESTTLWTVFKKSKFLGFIQQTEIGFCFVTPSPKREDGSDYYFEETFDEIEKYIKSTLSTKL